MDDVSVTNEQVNELREELGFNDPLFVQYGNWFADFIRLDFGQSYLTNQPVMEMIMSGLPATLELAVGALLVMLGIAIPLGSLAALYRGAGSINSAGPFLYWGQPFPAFGWGCF